jgi:hypothetical protein
MAREEGLASAQARLRNSCASTAIWYNQVPVEGRRDALEGMKIRKLC